MTLHVLALMHLVGKSALHHIGLLGRVVYAFSPNAWEVEMAYLRGCN